MHGNVVNPKYILFMSLKHLYECAKILACTEILSLAAETYSPCTETYSLCAETYVLAQKYFQVPVNFFGCAQKLLCPMRGFWASNYFGHAVKP